MWMRDDFKKDNSDIFCQIQSLFDRIIRENSSCFAFNLCTIDSEKQATLSATSNDYIHGLVCMAYCLDSSGGESTVYCLFLTINSNVESNDYTQNVELSK